MDLLRWFAVYGHIDVRNVEISHPLVFTRSLSPAPGVEEFGILSEADVRCDHIDIRPAEPPIATVIDLSAYCAAASQESLRCTTKVTAADNSLEHPKTVTTEFIGPEILKNSRFAELAEHEMAEIVSIIKYAKKAGPDAIRQIVEDYGFKSADEMMAVYLASMKSAAAQTPIVRPVLLDRRNWPLVLKWGKRSSPFDAIWKKVDGKGRHHTAPGQRVLKALAKRDSDLDIEMKSLERLATTRVKAAFVSRLQSALVGNVRDISRWGELDWADALRLRAITNSNIPKNEDACDLPIEWSGCLRWIGERLLETARLPEITAVKMPVYATAIAATAGYKTALDWVWRNSDGKARKRPEVQRVLSLLGLRVILSSSPTVTALSAVTLPVNRDRQSDGLWDPSEIAICAMAYQRRDAPLAQLLAKLMSEEFETRLGTILSTDEWNSEDRAGQEALFSYYLDTISDSNREPWSSPAHMGLNFESLANLLATYLETHAPAILWPLYLDPTLLTAALLGFSGNAISGAAHLDVVARRTRWKPTVQAVRNALARQTPSPGQLERWVLSTEAKHRELSSFAGNFAVTPDPNVFTGTPIWFLIEGRVDWSSDLMRERSASDFVGLRRCIRRPDLLELYEPYWLLMRRHKKALFPTLKAVSRFLRHPPEKRWREALELLARQAWEDVE